MEAGTFEDPAEQIKTSNMSNRTSPLRVCMLSAEARPYATDGGLADVVAALPSSLADLGV